MKNLHPKDKLVNLVEKKTLQIIISAYIFLTGYMNNILIAQI
jgi:hypothetical protein